MINVLTPINQLGYGVTGLNIVKALSRLTDVALWIIGETHQTSGIYDSSITPITKLTDLNNDGAQNILDVVKLVDNILK